MLVPLSLWLFSYAVNGAHIKTYGKKFLQLDSGLRRSFAWVLTIVTHSIIGADLLGHYGFLLDLQDKRLINKCTSLNVSARTLLSSQPSVLMGIFSEIADILKRYPWLIPEKPLFNYNNKSLYVIHIIDTNSSRARRRLPPDKLAQTKLEFEQFCALGICRPSESVGLVPCT